VEEAGQYMRSIQVAEWKGKEQAPRVRYDLRGLLRSYYFFFAAFFGFACCSFKAARAAASFAIVTRKGEQLT